MPTHLIRLGTHAEKEYLKKLKTFDDVILNANLIESTSEAMAVFADEMVRGGHRFIVDPYTHAFAVEPSQIHSSRQPKDAERPRVKATFAALAECFGMPLGDGLGLRSLLPTDLPDVVLRQVVKKTLDYQTSRLSRALAENVEFLGTEDVANLVPALILAPYFVDEFDGVWGTINRRSLEFAAEVAGERAGGVIAYDSRSADEGRLRDLAKAYSDAPVQNYFVWPTDLDEHHAAEITLSSYAAFVERLVGAGKSLVAFYGGFFALLLSYRGLSGVSHGVAYGDKRGMEPVAGGGLPPPMYYVRAVRDVIRIGDLPILAAGLSPEEFRERLCNCVICDGLLKQGGVDKVIDELTQTEYRTTARGELREVFAGSVYKLVKFHFLLNRADEVHEVSQPLEQVTGRMTREASWVASRLGPRSVAHITRWIKAVGSA